jgi:hypothetical protein
MRHSLTFALALAMVGCSHASDEPLDMAVHRYNDSLRWKRFSDAAGYLVPEARQTFLRRYLAAESDLFIDSLEVRGIAEVAAATPTYDVTVVGEAYVLPSTVLSRVVMTQRWELGETGWRLATSDHELAPVVATR